MRRVLNARVLLSMGFVLLTAASASAVGINGVRLSNNAEDWTVAGQNNFNGSGDVYIYVDLSYGDTYGYEFWGSCVVSLEATGDVLREVTIGSVMVYDTPVVRTQSFNINWPNSWVSVTCVPQGNPSYAQSVRLNPELWQSGGAAAAPSQTPPPQPQVIVVPVAAPTPDPEPVPDPTCREVLLDMGHDAFDLSYCDGANQRCAVALLRAGNDPFDLSYCQGISNLDCAVQLLQGGGDPFDLSYCN